jgi:hypothetical protein
MAAIGGAGARQLQLHLSSCAGVSTWGKESFVGLDLRTICKCMIDDMIFVFLGDGPVFVYSTQRPSLVD